MRTKIIYFTLGAFAGIAFALFYFYTNKKTNDKKYIYLTLNSDFCIEGGGLIPKGSYIRFDESFPEGFTRYILYLNVPDNYSGNVFSSQHEYEIIPYWIHEAGKDCNSE